jgi:hypothetical protein
VQPVFVQLVDVGRVAAAKLGRFRQLLQQAAAVTHDGHQGRKWLQAQARIAQRHVDP